MTEQRQKAIDFAFKMLAIRDYCEAELRLKMGNKGYSLADIDAAIKILVGKKFLDDRVYINKIIEKYTLKAPSGREFIRNFLEQKGLKKDQYDEALNGLNDLNTAKLAFRMRFKPLKKSENASKIRQKAANYLQTKGFEYDIIVQILNQEIKGDYEDEQ